MSHTSETTRAMSSSQDQHPPKKKRTLGKYPCPHCDKVFTRSDHLARHNLNHEPKKVYTCEFIVQESGENKRLCGKTFVRKDLHERHLRRHLELSTSGKSSSTPPPSESNSRKISGRKSSGSSTISSTDSMSQSQLQISNLIHNQGTIRQNFYNDLTNQNMQKDNFHQNNANVNHNLQNDNFHQNNSNINQITYANINPNIHANINPNIHANIHPNFNVSINPGLNSNNISNINRQNLSDYYNKSLNHSVPYSQNDILYWLFTDSPPNNLNLSSPEWTVIPNQAQQTQPSPQTYPRIQLQISPQDQLLLNQQLLSQQQSQQQLNQHQLQQRKHQQQQQLLNTNELLIRLNQNNLTDAITNSNQINLLGQRDSPLENRSDLIDFSNTNQIIPSPAGSQLSLNGVELNYDDQLNQFSNNNLNFPANYGLQDANIFLNDDNPLDEIFYKKYQNFKSENDMSGLSTTFTMNLNGNISSVSPTNSAESNKSPNPDTFNESNLTQESILPKLIEHSKKYNIAVNKQFFIDTILVNQILRSLNLELESIENFFKGDNEVEVSIENRFSFFLFLYWKVFHPQFTVLHKPSFNTKFVEPLLLASMLIIGCIYSYSPSEARIKERRKSPEFKFSLHVATSLRFQIFQHEEFRSPTKLWVLQSLNLLEWCEKNFLLRRMHERGHIHHGTNVQLLRRSPLLGGNPATSTKKPPSSDSATSAGEEDSDSNIPEISNESSDTTDLELFQKWVNSESMKRITFMTFYLDIIDHIKFRHNPQILFWQLQLLSLPCDDEQLWESSEVNGSFKKVIKRQRKLQQQRASLGIGTKSKKKDFTQLKYSESFLSALKRLMKPQNTHTTPKIKTSLFTQNIILAGLLALMYQMQQTELQSSSFLFSNDISRSHNQNKIWKMHLTRAIDKWYTETAESGYASYFAITEYVGSQPILFAMYQLSQIIGISDINHYDIAIYGGSPANMSVSASMKDVYVVQRKLNSIWSRKPSTKSINDMINFRSVVHCYWLLWQLMLKPVDDTKEGGCQPINWLVNNDYFDSMYAVGISTLVLWCYVYSTGGSESGSFLEIDDTKKSDYEMNPLYDNLIKLSAEGGYQYLTRIWEEFLTKLQGENLEADYNLHPLKFDNSPSLHTKLSKYCELLPNISNKQRISGLCFLVGTKLLQSQWEVIRENAKLIINCGLRSIGKTTILCENLFDNEFVD